MPNFAGLRLRRRRRLEAREAPLDLGNDRLVLDRPRRRHHHVRPAIMRGEIAVQHDRCLKPLQRLRRAEQRTSHRLVGIAEFVEMLEHDIVGRILRRADFLLDDALLALELFGIETRIGEDIAQHLERERHVRLHHPRIIGRGLDAGGGIEIAADRLDLLGDLARGSRRGALERHVLEQMRNAMLVGLLVAASNPGPYAERSRLQMRHGVGDDREAGRKLGDIDTHPATPCLAARLTDSTNRSISA